jgi:RHS repeat-associated protein
MNRKMTPPDNFISNINSASNDNLAANSNSNSNSSQNTSILKNIIGFNGERHDPATDLYHLGNGLRAYSPRLMRFYSADSISPFGAGGINSYTYCLGDPLNRIDHTGHLSVSAWIGIGLGVLGLLISIATLGMGIAAGVSMMTTGTALAIAGSTFGIASAVTGIVSAALEESNPQASSALGWASMGFGIGGFVTGIGASRLAATTALRVGNAGASAARVPQHGGLFGVSLVGTAVGTGVTVAGEVLDSDELRIMGGVLLGASALGGMAGMRSKPYRSGLSAFAADALADPAYQDNYRRVTGATRQQQFFINSVDHGINRNLSRW